MLDFVPVKRVLKASRGPSYLARYFTGEEAGRIAAGGEGSAIQAQSKHLRSPSRSGRALGLGSDAS